MQLLVIRHAIAEDRDQFAESGRPDSERPLTDFGRRRMRKNVRGLRRIVAAPDIIGTSPFLRAADTARIVAETLGVERVETVDALTPEHRPADLLTWLGQQPSDNLVAIVGHEPHLGTLITWLLSGRESPNAQLKKGGVCLLDFQEPPAGGTGVLQWLLTPAHLRAIAD